ncbi:NtrZ family periplasmic regulatory protein [Phenylobacterium montanum]|uniref:Uncharacterized protein n=1 Tax=Phenylobacterium montanum TaxID=2823693 RepID=A0A975FYH7_9CAUL|nr:hypothetical protein [Caulobacter sp. S6]QUD86636.1 hypothetical protein KCG34_16320 [Caulobacter sp. S6]
MAAKARISAVAIAAMVLMGASLAHADSARPTLSVTNTPATPNDFAQFGLAPIHKSVQWDDKGHWSLKLDMNTPAGRDMQLRDVQAGAYYHLTPSLHVGGAVSLGDEQVSPDRNLPQTQQAPRVKLETRFKF